jgi:hypothetical protein
MMIAIQGLIIRYSKPSGKYPDADEKKAEVKSSTFSPYLNKSVFRFYCIHHGQAFSFTVYFIWEYDCVCATKKTAGSNEAAFEEGSRTGDRKTKLYP